MIAVFAETADGDIHIQTHIGIHHTEGHRRGRPVLIPHQFFGVEIVNALIFGRFAAEGETLADISEHFFDALSQRTAENRGFRGHIVGVLPGFRADIHHFPLFDNEHTLAVGHGDD